jgi:glycerophosphoryl diester phosphodiesterase
MLEPLSPPLLLGHRGCRGAEPENTLAAFDLAARTCHGFEFDVRGTSDGKPIICHEERVGRQPVSKSTFEALRRKNSDLLCLEDVLTRYSSTAFLNLEIKVSGLEHAVISVLRGIGPASRIVVSSFLPEVIHNLRLLDEQLALGYIFNNSLGMKLWRNLPIQYVMPHYKLVNSKMIEQFHSEEIRVFTWTVNNPKQMLALLQRGVDGLISDDPVLLRRTVAERRER